MIYSIVPPEDIFPDMPQGQPERESLIMGVRVSLRGDSISRILSSDPFDYIKAASFPQRGYGRAAVERKTPRTMKNRPML